MEASVNTLRSRLSAIDLDAVDDSTWSTDNVAGLLRMFLDYVGEGQAVLHRGAYLVSEDDWDDYGMAEAPRYLVVEWTPVKP